MSNIPCFYIGQLVRVTAVFTDSATNLPIDPDTVTLTVKDPNANVTNPSVNNPSVGNYDGDVDANVAGIWNYRFASTGNGQAAREGKFEIKASGVI